MGLNLFATLTGLHLAVMQFCFFFILLVNVTSTYVTYISVVIAWMIGTIIGLLLSRLHAGVALLAGGLSYYVVYLLVVSDPLAPTTLPVATFGVAVTGLWAGRFFVVMLPLFSGADRLFFHENNGFLLGIIAVFIGFVMMGLPFLLWTPAISIFVLIVYLRVLHQRYGYEALSLFGKEAVRAGAPKHDELA